MLSLDMAMDMDMELLQSMCPSLTMDMAITLPVTLMVTILDMDMARGLLMPSQDMVEPPTIPMEVAATLTEPPKVLVDTMEVMDMVDMVVMARGPLMLDMAMVMLPATLTEAPGVFMD